jgi:uroporphyrinogen-III synthase
MKALVTRPIEDAGRLVSALAERRIGALVEPMIEIRFLSGPAPDLEGVQAILATSANGVRALAHVSDVREVPLVAVGDATAEAARALRFSAVASAAGALPDLVEFACSRLRPESGRLVYVAGSTRAGDLKGALEERGFGVDRAVLYEARLAASLSAETVEALASGAVDLALFFSPRTASTFVRLAEGAAVARHCAAIRAVSVSPATDAALARLSWRDRIVAPKPTLLALLDALDNVLGAGR